MQPDTPKVKNAFIIHIVFQYKVLHYVHVTVMTCLFRLPAFLL